MVSLTLMARLLEALRPKTRLILVGDPDQLASVEAGAVLGDLVDRSTLGARTPAFASALKAVLPDATVKEQAGSALNDGISALTTNRRFSPDSHIQQLATAIRDGDARGRARSAAGRRREPGVRRGGRRQAAHGRPAGRDARRRRGVRRRAAHGGAARAIRWQPCRRWSCTGRSAPTDEARAGCSTGAR